MTIRAAMAGIAVVTMLAQSPACFAQTTGHAQLSDRLLPVAAGALVGAAASFFILPLIVPGTAVAATAGASPTAGPLVAAIGAGIGGFLGYGFAH